MLEEKVIPIDFGQGVDTKTDPKLVVAGKLLRLENGVFNEAKRISKRNGYESLGASIVGGSSLSSPKMVHGYEDELLCSDSGLLYAYSPSKTGWVSRGPHKSVEISRRSLDQSLPNSGYSDCAVLGNYTLFVYETVSSSTFTTVPKVYGLVVDNQSGTVVLGPSLLSTGAVYTYARPRAVTLGGSALAVVYTNAAGTALVSRTVSFSSGVSFSGETTVSANLTNGPFDIVATSIGAGLLYGSTGGLTISTLNTSGAVAATATRADANIGATGYILFHISQHSTTGDFWIYWTNTNVPGSDTTIVYAVYSSALAVVLTETNVVSLSSPYFCTNMVSVTASSTQQTLYYGVYSTDRIDYTNYVTQNVSGTVGSPAAFAYGVLPFSRPFSETSTNYAVFISRGTDMNPTGGTVAQGEQHTYFVVKLATPNTVPVVVARFAYAVGASSAVLQSTIGYMPQAASRSSAKFEFACAVTTQILPSSQRFPSDESSIDGLFSYLLEYDGENINIAKNCGDMAVFNGGLMQAYDGLSCNELGFHLAPEIVALAESTTGSGAISNGAYSYIAIFQWIDANGNLHQSATSTAAGITTTGMNNTVTVTVTTAFLTQKSNVAVALFRTQNAGSIYYQVTDPVFITLANPTAAVVQFVDINSDSSIADNLQPYTYPGSAVLENTTAPPAMVILSHNNRLQFVDAENPNTYWYSKTIQPSVGISPSGFLTQTIDAKFGVIKALGEMDDKLAILKEDGIAVQAGDGANDTGNGSTLSNPQFIPSDVGCTAVKSVITMPEGIMFKSENGIYLLNRALGLAYIGADVSSYNSQTITAATAAPGETQIRFLCSSGLTLVYDYLFKQWSTFTNHTGTSATAYGSSYVYLTSANAVFKESSSSYLDNATAYALKVQTSWLALGSVQGFQRVKRLIMLGDFTNGGSASHALSIRAAYDFSTTFQSAISYAFGAISASGVFQYRERLPIQKCDAVSLLIEETTTGDSAEYIDLTNISFEAGIKKGLNKLGGTKSVG